MKRKSLLFLLILAFGLPWMASAQKTLPYEYGFENNLTDEGWSMGGSSFQLGIASGTGHSGDCYFQFYGTYDQYQYLVSPELSLTTNGLLVEFYYKNNNTYYPQSFQVGYSTTDNGISHFEYGEEVVTASDAKWTFYSKVFPSNTKYISVRRNIESNYLYVDDFCFAEYSTSLAPKDLVLYSYTSTTATINWSERAGQDHWDIYFTDGDEVPNSETAPSISNTDTKPYTIDVASEILYKAYVRANFGENDYSAWSEALSFEVGCYTPTNFRVTTLTCNSARLQWNAGGNETSWQLVYSDQQGFNPDAATPETLTSCSKTISDLTTNTTYYARVRAVCDATANDYSPWTDELSFTPICKTPSALHASEVTLNSATLTWTKGSNETQWELSYSTTESFNPENGTKVTVNSNTYTLNGLTLNTQYYAYVRAICGENVTSDWSEMCSFKPSYTLTVNDAADLTNYVPLYGSLVSGTINSQFIIPSDALSSLENATVNKLVFHSYYTSRDFGTATFDVCMKEVDETTFSSTTMDWSDTTRVYYGSVSVSGRQMEISFNKSFTYHGGELMVGFAQTNPGSASSTYWYGTTTTTNTALLNANDNASMVKFLPKTTIYYTPGPAPTCVKPNNLVAGDITYHSANLTWDAGEGNNWNVQYRASSSSEWTSAGSVSTPTCALSGLDAATRYIARVQTQCEGDDVSSWKTVSFTTECGPVSLPYSHDFDNDETGSNAGLPQCWTKINDANADYPYVMGSNAHSGSNCLFFYRLASYYGENQLAVLPEMATDIRLLQLSFYARLGSGTNKPLAVGVMTDPEDKTTFVKMEDVTIASTEYAQYTVSFDTYAGNGRYIAVKCEPDGYDVTGYYVDDIAVTANNICFAPANPQISDVTANSAFIIWTPDGSTTNWQVQYKKTTDADWSEPIAVNGTPTYTFSNLDATTTYQARVRTDCGNDNYSDWVDAENFTTDCGFVTLPYSHNFDDDATGHVAPTCWHFSNGTYPYIYESSSAHSGNHYLQIKKNTDYAATLVLPAIDTDENPINTLKLTFWARSSQSTYYYEYLYAGVMTDPDDMSTFQSVQGATTNLSTTTYKQFEFYFDNWTGEGNYIALRYGGSTTYYIDDIEVSVAPTCRQPLDLSTQYTNAHEAEIRWKTRDLRQCNYQVSYSTDATFNPEDGTIVDVEFENTLVNAGTPYRDYYLTCLNANTTYYYYVRANCGNGDFSEWSDDYASLTTGEPCPAPNGFYANTVKNTYAELRWYGDIESDWDFQYKKTSDAEWITPTEMEFLNGEGSEIIFRLSGLESGVEYQCRVREHCGMYSCPTVDDGYSDWVSEIFTTTTGCSAPEPWMCLTQMGTSAKLEWYQTGEETRWQIRYRLSTEYEYPAENIVLTDEMPEARKQRWTITGLQTNSMYYWQVRAYCDSENQSDWSEESYFFTGGEKTTVDKNHPFFEDFEGTSGMPDGWMRCNQYNYNLDYYYPWSFTPAEGPSWDERPGNHGIYNNSDDYHGSTSVLTPEMHIDANAYSAKLSFWDYCDYGPSAISGQNISYGSMQVMVSSDHGENFDYVWWSFGPKRYWHQFFVDLDEYKGRDIIIRFDYWWANNNPNFDWYIDDVEVQVFDNSFGSGSGITSGDWNDPSMWGNGTPNGDDNVIINANVNIPEGVVAEANQIVINTDTINTGSKAQKFGKLTIADGGQLKVNNSVTATMQKNITASETKTSNAWYAISSPVNNIAIADFVQGIHNVYQYDEPSMMWQEYRNDDNIFENLTNGRGYLYRSTATGIEFTGDINVGEVSCQLSYACADNRFKGFNLIGNPYPHNIYKGENAAIPNTWLEDGFYTLTESGAWSAGTDNATPIKPNTGILVQAKSDANMKNLVFTDTDGHNTAKSGDDNIMFAVKNSVYSDVAYVLFKEGRGLNKIEHRNADIQMLYVINDGEDFAIADMNDNTKLINLGFEAKTMGQYTISVKAEGEFSYMHLVDKLTGDDTNMLMENSYTFVGTPGDRLDRFVLRLDYNAGHSTDSETFAYQSGSDIIVSGEGELQVFDIMGRMVATQQINGVGTWRAASVETGIYIFKLNGKTQKMIIR